MKLAKKVLLVFALIVIIGGLYGMISKESVESLIAGVISGALLLYSRWLWGEKNLPGLIVGLVVSIALLGRFASVAVRDGLTMWPGGVVIFFSVVTIVVLTALSLTFGLDLRVVGDMGDLPSSLPTFFIPDVPFTLETLQIILPYSAGIAVVGLLESLMTAQVVDDLTDTGSNKNQECYGQGIANTVTGFFGGLVSSTAMTLSFARRSKSESDQPGLVAMGILLAWTVMSVRVVIAVAVLNPAIVPSLLAPIGALGIASLACVAYFYSQASGEEKKVEESQRAKLKNPFSLSQAMKFGSLFAVVLLSVALAREFQRLN